MASNDPATPPAPAPDVCRWEQVLGQFGEAPYWRSSCAIMDGHASSAVPPKEGAPCPHCGVPTLRVYANPAPPAPDVEAQIRERHELERDTRYSGGEPCVTVAKRNKAKSEWLYAAQLADEAHADRATLLALLQEARRERALQEDYRLAWVKLDRQAAALRASKADLLAALRAYVDYKPFDQRFDHCGFMNATQLTDRDGYVRIRDAARKAIAEHGEG